MDGWIDEWMDEWMVMSIHNLYFSILVNSDKKVILTELHHLLSYESNFQVFRDVLDKVSYKKGIFLIFTFDNYF